MRILLAEDDKEFRFILAEALRDEGHTVTECGTLRDGADVILDQNFDVLALDVFLEAETSFGIAHYASFANPGCHIIFMTGSGRFAQAEVFQICTDTAYFFRKPLKILDFMSLIGHIEARMFKTGNCMPSHEAPLFYFGETA